ncbi:MULTISPECIES: ead/Ea22-like family protein [Citrobacter]|jgi:DNA repair exonuclease SbcCD ATPase subunit|uniref:ead/Ea22-like family protein n=1 Tax=Enterobacteriaceae TaxID=543 RepID=UPI002011C193|nr:MULTISPECIES: ead/Ea22-like family protein [Citrobacter]MDM3375259.1 ead/Ea22-like family protein [Citrobacter sp. Cb010]MDM3458957.1 ead/Ea22-like family protein [Citrobacter sp. Cb036]
MTALNKQAYRADGGDIGIGRLKEIADNAYGDEEKRWMAQRVLSLLDENLQLQRDKDSLEAVAIAMRDDMRDAREKLEAEKNNLIDSECHVAELEEALRDKQALLEAAEKRIAELEARTVKLPEYRNSPDMHTKQFYEAIGFNQGLDVFIEALRAAGIGVKGD